MDNLDITTVYAVANFTTAKPANVIEASRTLQVIYLIIGLFGFISNIYVVTVIGLYKPMHKQLTNIYIVNQSSIDTVVAACLFFTSIYEDNGSVVRTPGNTADELLCRLWYTKMPLWGMLVSSSYGIVALTFERFVAVVYPIWHKTNFTKNRVMIGSIIVFTWIFGPAYNIAYSSPISKITEDGSCTVYSVWPNKRTQTAVGVFTVFVQFFIPLFLLMIGYIKMALVLHRRVDVSEGVNGKYEPSGVAAKEAKRNEGMARARSNVIKTLAIVAFFFTLCWSWNQIYYILFHMGLPNFNFTNNFYNFTVVMVFVNCCVNPVIYTVNYSQFRAGVKHVLLSGRRKIQPSLYSVNLSNIGVSTIHTSEQISHQGNQ